MPQKPESPARAGLLVQITGRCPTALSWRTDCETKPRTTGPKPDDPREIICLHWQIIKPSAATRQGAAMLWRNRFSPQSFVLRAPLDASRGASSYGESSSREARQGRVGGRAAGALGIDGGIVGRFEADAPAAKPTKQGKRKTLPPHHWQELRRTIWVLSRTAAKLVYPEGTPAKQIKGVGTCRWAVRSNVDGVDVMMSTYDESGQKRASYNGLQTCGLVWQCPACAARISETRRRQVNTGLEWAKAQGHRIVMLTLTARHGEDDNLKDLLSGMKEAKRAFHQHRRWKKIKPDVVAMLTATEVTHGKNGWHPHFHVVVIVRSAEAEAALADLGDTWRASLRGQDLDGADAAFDCQNATAAGKYVSKWGAGEELTLSGKKRAKGKGQTPLNLLEAHKAGNEDAGDLWLEYVAAFHRRTQLDGLAKLVRMSGQEELTDAEAAQDEAQKGQEREEAPLVNISSADWKERGRQRRTDILDAAESDGAAGVRRVLYGDEYDPDELIETERAIPPPYLGKTAKAALSAMIERRGSGLVKPPPALPPELGRADLQQRPC